MKRRLLLAVTSALGVATICCLWIVGPLILPSHEAIYHWNGPARAIFIPTAIDFASVWIFFSFLLFVAQGEKRGSINLWVAICVYLPWIALKSVSLLMNWALPHWISLSLFVLSAISVITFCICFRPDHHRVSLDRVRNKTIDFLCIVAISGAIALIQLAWFGWRAHGLDISLQLRRATSPTTQIESRRSRFIWIILDELSYQQVYGHRFHSLDLPAFDRFAKQSSVFTNVAPAGVMTEIVMPSLITGLPVDKIQPSPDGFGLKIHNPATKEWIAFDQHDTVFSDALSVGYSTAIAGWYNPYCRILPEVLDHCFWVWGQPGTNLMLPRASIAENTLNPLLLNSRSLNDLASTITHGNIAEDILAKTHISDYQQISDSADQLLQNPAIDFVLIHMAIPHPGGIYNRATHAFRTRNATYIDNLALADSYLAHVRLLLEAQEDWDSSAIVVMGDHSWRTKGWAASPDWTSEEQAASDGQFDDRPGYIVKLPDQKIGNTVDTPFSALHTRWLFDAIMAKRIVSTKDLSRWLGTVDSRSSKKGGS